MIFDPILRFDLSYTSTDLVLDLDLDYHAGLYFRNKGDPLSPTFLSYALRFFHV